MLLLADTGSKRIRITDSERSEGISTTSFVCDCKKRGVTMNIDAEKKRYFRFICNLF